MKAAVKDYTGKVQAEMRATARHGLTHKPRSTMEVGMLLQQELHTLSVVGRGLLDIMRADVSSLLSRMVCGTATEANRMA